MKNMIDRYLYDVARRLPENMREDVMRELRSNIEDMLSENPTEDEIEKVLTELGSPAKLAVKYNPRPKYLISPELFDDYFTVLKIVAITLAVILVALAVFQTIFSDNGGVGALSITGTITAMISGIFSGAYNGIVYAFFWVTVVFFCVGYFGDKKELRPWSPKSLPEVPKDQKAVIKRADTIAGAIFSILFSTLFLVLTLRNPPVIAWYEAGAPVVPLFNEELVRAFLPLFVFLMVLTLVVAAVKLIKGRWTVSVAIAQCLQSVVGAVISLTFINQPHVFTDAFIARFAEKVHVTSDVMAGNFRIAITVIVVLTVIGTIAEIIQTISRTAKNYR